MRSFLAAIFLATLAVAHGNMFLQDGKEYIYATEASAAAGTMDYATGSSGFSYKMKTRIQVSGKTLNVKFENMKFSQFVGTHESKAWPYENTQFTDLPADAPAFSVSFDSNGLFKSLTVPSSATTFQKNLFRGWAAQLQINTGELKAGKSGFKSKEQLLQGNCQVTYTKTPKALRKSVSHTTDCENRVYRLVDDYRGFKCDMSGGPNTGMGYPSSLGNTVFLIDPEKNQINAMISTGSFIAQFFEEEGAAQYVYTNSTSKLVNVKSSGGDISASGQTITDLSYEWSDGEFQWNQNRDLKAREPFLASGQYFEDDQAAVMMAVKKGIAGQKDIMEGLDSSDKESIQKAHKYGINSILPALWALNYDSLKSIADELYADKSDTGVMKANIFGELLGSAGTTASAMLIKDMVMNNKFDNDRDAARVLTSVPFHIRRPNEQLVKEYEALLNFDGGRFTKMAAPLVLGHLVRITCERAGPFMSPATISCVKQLATSYAEKVFQRYQSAGSMEEKSTQLAVLTNLRWGGISKLLKPVVFGESEQEPYLRASALWATGWEVLMTGKGFEYFMPIFSDRTLNHELRIGALEMLFYSRPGAAELGTIMTVLYGEKDYEVVNYAYTLFEKYASSIDPCHKYIHDLCKYFLKYMRQYSNYDTDYGFGVSKTYVRQFNKKKYGYAGSLTYYCIGSHASTTPLSVGFGVTNTMMNNYHSFILSGHFRLQGVAKGILRKIKKTMEDPVAFKTADLEKILSGEMGIRERPDQPVRAQIILMLKGTVFFQRFYDETAADKDGYLGSFVEKLKGLGDTYSINHQRAMQVGSMLYEQPTNLGLPMAVMSGVSVMGNLQATIKRGNHRGLLYRDVQYDMHMFTQAARIAMIPHKMKKATFGIINSRIYHGHVPRKIVVGVNPIKKELKLSISRPAYDHPLKIMMHSQTSVVARGHNVRGAYDGLKANCPDCENRVIISRGPKAVKGRVIFDRENQKVGSYLFAQYFDCEMDISRGNTIRHGLGALMPYNKNPKNAYTSLTMGIRQTRAFFYFFPKTEQCGLELRWSQAKNNPVKEIEISIRGNVEKNGDRMFFRGRKWFIKALIKAKGEPADRSYRINFGYEFTPGNLKNKVKLVFNRAPVPALGMDPYSVCMDFQNQYPDFSKEFMDYDKGEMAVSGNARVQYGKGTSCNNPDGEIKVNFKHSTTDEAREELKDKWYYQQCMDMKNSQAWSKRKGFPLSEACYKTVQDATMARKYTWKVDFVKLTNRMKRIISYVRSALKAGLLPYVDSDMDEDANGDDVGPFLNMDATLKNSEKAVDIKMETSQGEEEFNDVPLRLNWTKRLRNLKFTGTLRRLFDAKIINPCVATSETVRTMDNVTFSYEPSSCWTLTSAKCGPSPMYAVFTKKGSSGMPLDAMVYIGGHSVEFTANGPGNIDIKVNGSPVSIADQGEHALKEKTTDILKIFRWGSTYNMYSFLKVWIVYDGNFIEVVPSPSTKGQHCGICGNYNRNKYDEWQGKNFELFDNTDALVDNWKWKC